MSLVSVATVLTLLAVVWGQTAYQLPAGAETLLTTGSLSQTFSCGDLPYGYYADVDNGCQVFHVCLPASATDDGAEQGVPVLSAQFSFLCANQTVFRQDLLTCAFPDEGAFPCADSQSLFESSNALFGVIPEARGLNDNIVQ